MAYQQVLLEILSKLQVLQQMRVIHDNILYKNRHELLTNSQETQPS